MKVERGRDGSPKTSSDGRGSYVPQRSRTRSFSPRSHPIDDGYGSPGEEARVKAKLALLN